MDAARSDSELLLQLYETEDLAAVVADLERTMPTLSQCLTGLLEQKALKRPRVVAEAHLNGTFGYQIFVGQRHASRNKLLALCIAMRTTPEEANRVLRSGGVNELYVASRRDAIIAYGLVRGYSLQQIEADLYAFQQPTIQ